MRWAALGLAAAFFVSGCGSAPVHHLSPGFKVVSGKALVSKARTQLGRPYKFGGKTPATGFDCSGLVYWTYKQFGSVVPAGTQTLWSQGRSVDRDDLEIGDLVFFDTRSVKPGHVGFYTGGGKFLHAPSSGGKVREERLDHVYWKKAWYGARRLG